MAERKKSDPSVYEVQEGEALPEVAASLGLPYALFYEKDRGLADRRPNPNLLAPGDRLQLPTLTAKAEKGKTGQEKQLEAPDVPRVLRLRLVDAEGAPLARLRYAFQLEGEEAWTPGAADGDGLISIAIPAARPRPRGTPPPALLGSLRIGKPPHELLFHLRMHRLLPLRSVRPELQGCAVKQRLHNLGYAVSSPQLALATPGTPLDGSAHVALACFQADQGIEPTGEPDDVTLKKLEEAHGC